MDKIIFEKVGQRLKQARELRHITLEEAGKKVDVHKSTVLRWENGETEKIKFPVIEVLANYYNVNPVWLMGYDVPIERETLKSIPLSELQQTEIPVLGKVKAGYDYLAEENIIGHIYLDFKPSDPENYYALQVTGDSMEPLFSDGDIAIVHKQDTFDNGNTCIILVNGDEATVKKVVKMDNGIDLIAMNPYYPVRHFTKNEMDEIPVKIIGKVIEARKRKIFE